MRQVVGNSTHELDACAFATLREGYDELVLDLGTGDGKHVLAVARERPRALVVGVDASAQAMRATASRAARKPTKGGVANALFVWASAQALPVELTAVSEVHVLMPWGSLLRALVEPSVEVLRGVAAGCRPGAPFLITLNLHAWRPAVPEVGATQEPSPDSVSGFASAYRQAGWHLEAAQYLDGAQIAALGTSWTKRLRSSRDALAVLALRGRIDPG